MIAATRQLIAQGYRRISLITVLARRVTIPGNVEQAFLDELAAHGIPIGSYNLPAWEETPEGLYVLLENLFKVTPSTALIIEETPRVVAALRFFVERGIRVPDDVSLVSGAFDPSFAWCHRVIAHMEWDNAPIIRRIVRWLAAVRQGRADRKTINYSAQFIPGNSIGPARKR
jgi:DNA-binding LacI/PurR family transcriptional regulator